LCVALGSSHAARCLGGPEREKVLKVIAQSKDLFGGISLYADYLRCLAALLGDPPAGAPEFMSGAPWQAKSCQTALAGWAQWRHTWILHAKQTVIWLCSMDAEHPVGFVEPNPAFFRRLHDLATQSARLLDRVKPQDDANLHAAAQLQDLLRFLEAKTAAGEPLDLDNPRPFDDIFCLFTLEQMMRDGQLKADRRQPRQFAAQAMPQVKVVLQKIQRGELSGRLFAGDWSSADGAPLGERWRNLAGLAARLEGLAKKQLARTPFTGEDREFILSYGTPLARLMRHTGDRSETPRDDVPRIADVVYNPSLGEYLEVGVGRPRIMYVLYPTAQGEVFCRGGVLPYYEFRSRARLDDIQWKAMLSSWVAPKPSIEARSAKQ
jgi:hypothetical protein